jgi:hypothetical protein
MSLEKLKRKFKSYKRLLEADTLGSFDFFTCIVCLDSVDSSGFKEFQKALVSKDYSILSKITPLAVHEFTHFIDSTSTIWGMNHLRKMNEAYCSNNVKGGTEEGFYKAKSFLEHARSLRLPDYYTLIDSSKSPTRPWQSRITMGKQFGLDGKIAENPILFSHFSNAHGELLARSPVSTVSILEASAMSNEMVIRLALINNLDENERLVESGIYQREALNYIYNQNITEYSVCVHIVANQLQCKDLFAAFQICSIITRLVLNFPKALLDTVAESAEIHELLGISEGHEFEIRMRTGIKSHNLGILYFLICNALPKDTAESRAKMIAGIETALSKICLSLDLVAKEASKEIEEIAGELNSSKLKAIKILSESGVDNFRKIPLTSTNLDLSKLSLPAAYLGDGTEVSIFKNENSLLKNVSIEEIFDELYEGQEWVERFSEACTA